MVPVPQAVCTYETMEAFYVNTEVHLEPGDSLRFVVHTSPDTILGQIAMIVDEPLIDFDPDFIACDSLYYVSAVAGLWSGGAIDLNDPCLDVSLGQPIRFLCAGTVDAGEDETVCGLSTTIRGQSTIGKGRWTSLDSGLSLDSLNQLTAEVTAMQAGNYRVEFRTGTYPCIHRDTIRLTFHSGPRVDRWSVDTICLPGKDSFIVTFEVSNTDTNAVVVEGGAGNLTGNRFTSDVLPGGSGFLYVVRDSSGCGQDTVSGDFECHCLSVIGKMRSDHEAICHHDTVFAAQYYDPAGQVISGDDKRNFILTNDLAHPFDHIVERSDTGIFVYDANIHTLGQPYYMILVIGYQLPSGLVDLEDACLLQTDPVTITWFEAPYSTEIVKSHPEIDCNQREITLSVQSPIDTTGFSFEWISADSAEIAEDEKYEHTLEVHTPGTYHVVLSHPDAECYDTASIEVNRSPDIPVAQIVEPQIINCYRDTIMLSGKGSSEGNRYKYQWTGPGLIGNPQALEVQAVASGMYHLSVSDTVLDCQSEVEQMVEADLTEPRVEVKARDEFGCQTDEVTIEGTGSDVSLGHEYQWDILSDTGHIIGSSAEVNIRVGLPGEYQLTIIDLDNGCMNAASTIVTSDSNLIEDVTFDITHPSCGGEEDGRIAVDAITGGLGPYRYSIGEGENFGPQSYRQNLQHGDYPILIEEASGCQFHDTISLNPPIEFSADAGTDLEILLGEEVSLMGESDLPDSLTERIQWKIHGDSVLIDAFSWIGHPPIGIHDFIFGVMAINGCEQLDTISVHAIFEERIFVPNAIRPGSPHTENQVLTIYADPVMTKHIYRFEIIDRWGRQVFERVEVSPSLEVDPAYSWDGTFSGRECQEGVYIWIAEVEFATGEQQVLTGEVHLIR